MADENLICRIKKLLALSNSANPHEAVLALKRAQKLMLEHQLSTDDLSKSSFKEEKLELLKGLREKKLASLLCAVLASSFGLEGILHQKGRSIYAICLIGPDSRLEGAIYVGTVLQRQAANVRASFRSNLKKELELKFHPPPDYLPISLKDRYLKECKAKLNAAVRRECTAYMYGFFQAIHSKVTAYILDDTEEKLRLKYLKEHYPKLKSTRQRRLLFDNAQFNAYLSGQKEGKDGFLLFKGVKSSLNPRLSHD